MRERVRQIVRAIAIDSPTTYHFAGRVMTATAGTTANPLVAQLAQQLYQYCYCQRFDGTLCDAMQSELPSADEQTAFAARLSQGNTGADRWDIGWRIVSMLPSGQIMAQKGDSVRLLWGGEFMTVGSAGMPPAVGASIHVHVPRESWTLQPGYYYALGTAVTDVQDDRSLVRLYWNVSADAVPSLLRLLTHTLNRFAVPFRFKCQVNPAGYTRIDGTVLFVSRRYYHFVAELIAGELLPGIAGELEGETPLFTKRLADGLAVAEDPGGGESFGVHRCRLLAEGVWSAFERGVGDETQRLAAVVDCFAKNGLDLEHPYLNAGSRDIYTLDVEPEAHAA